MAPPTVRLDVDVPELKVHYPKMREVPPGLPSLHFIGLVVGSRGSGKTTALVKLVQALQRGRVFDRVILFSPSQESDPKYALFDKMHGRIIRHATYSDALFRTVVDEIEGTLDAWRRWRDEERLYREWLRDKDRLAHWRPADVAAIEAMRFRRPEPPPDCRDGQPPQTLLIFDDQVGTSLFRSAPTGPFANFALRHRHLHCSLLTAQQTVKGAFSRQLRSNLSLLMLFGCKNVKMAEELAQEFASVVSAADFMEMWTAATRDPHEFFYVDFFEAPPEQRFRIGFDRAFARGEVPRGDVPSPQPPDVGFTRGASHAAQESSPQGAGKEHVVRKQPDWRVRRGVPR